LYSSSIIFPPIQQICQNLSFYFQIDLYRKSILD